MITIISGTNRIGSKTLIVSKMYYNLIKDLKQEVHLVSLEDFKEFKRNEYLISIEKELLIPSDKFVFVMPEYNGGFPGVLKTLLDLTDIRNCWWYKKALLVGVADGRGGNLRGIDQMTNILHYLKVNVHHNKLPLSKINQEMTDEGKFKNPLTIQVIENQIAEFVSF